MLTFPSPMFHSENFLQLFSYYNGRAGHTLILCPRGFQVILTLGPQLVWFPSASVGTALHLQQ